MTGQPVTYWRRPTPATGLTFTGTNHDQMRAFLGDDAWAERSDGIAGLAWDTGAAAWRRVLRDDTVLRLPGGGLEICDPAELVAEYDDLILTLTGQQAFAGMAAACLSAEQTRASLAIGHHLTDYLNGQIEGRCVGLAQAADIVRRLADHIALPDNPGSAAMALEIDPHTGNLRLPEGSPITEQASDYIGRILASGLDELARKSTQDGSPS